MKRPLILKIKSNSLDDGPGIRSVIFFKGCPLDCTWCHNPESKSPLAEISYDANKCAGCGQCLEICPEDALDRKYPYFIERRKCTLCGQCVSECPSGALSMVGDQLAAEDVLVTVLKDKPFFDTSGGGVTLSGGEPTAAMDYCGELLRMLKQEQVHTLVETCGLFDLDHFDEKVYPFLDMIYFDIKLLDDTDHVRHCGVSNALILNNFRKLYRRYREGGIPVVPRTPLIPGMTDSRNNLHSIIEFLKQCQAKTAELLPYHPLWREKNHKLGIPDPTDGQAELDHFVNQAHLQACRALFLEAGIQV